MNMLSFGGKSELCRSKYERRNPPLIVIFCLLSIFPSVMCWADGDQEQEEQESLVLSFTLLSHRLDFHPGLLCWSCCSSLPSCWSGQTTSSEANSASSLAFLSLYQLPHVLPFFPSLQLFSPPRPSSLVPSVEVRVWFVFSGRLPGTPALNSG